MNISPKGYRYLVPALLPLAGLYLRSARLFDCRISNIGESALRGLIFPLPEPAILWSGFTRLVSVKPMPLDRLFGLF